MHDVYCRYNIRWDSSGGRMQENAWLENPGWLWLFSCVKAEAVWGMHRSWAVAAHRNLSYKFIRAPGNPGNSRQRQQLLGVCWWDHWAWLPRFGPNPTGMHQGRASVFLKSARKIKTLHCWPFHHTRHLCLYVCAYTYICAYTYNFGVK